MTVQTEEVEYCKLQVHYTADPDVVMEKRDEAVDALKKSNVKVPGFRTPLALTKNKKKKKVRRKSTKFRVKNGKKTKKGTGLNARNSEAFERALKAYYKGHIEKTIMSELVSEGFDETLYETKIKPIGYPEISNQLLDGNNFSCDMLFMHKPSFELKEYKEFEIPDPEVGNAAEEAEKMAQDLRVQHGDVVPYEEDDFVQEGDSLTMDITTTIDGKEVESLTQQGLFYTLGQFTNEDFDNNLLGMKAGDQKTFKITFPDEEQINPDLRGKEATFDVSVHMGTKKKPAPLDDELAKKCGVETYKELRTRLEGTASQRMQVRRNIKLSNQIITRLVENHDFEVPAWLVLIESQRAAQHLGKVWDDLSDDEIKELNEDSKKQVKLSLILDSVRETEPEAVFSEGELLQKLQRSLVQQGHQNANQIMQQMHANGTLIGHVARLRDEATVQWLVNTCKVVE
jgi:trigger factor